MPSFRKLPSGKWQVRWKEPDGHGGWVERSTTVTSIKARDIVYAAVKLCEETGQRYEPERSVVHVPLLGEAVSAYVVDRARSCTPRTLANDKNAFKLFARFLDQKYARTVTIADLSRDMLSSFYDFLFVGVNGERDAYTKQRIVNKVEAAWRWLFDTEWHALVPRPKTIPMLVEPDADVVAATFDEMARCVRACVSEGPRRLATILYFTGVRTGMGEAIEWSALDEERGTLTVPPQKGLPGYTIPLSPHFLAELATWPRESPLMCGWSVVDQTVRTRLNEAWARAKVRRAVWEGSPGQAFRVGLTSSLMEAGVHKEIAEVYVGRSIEGARARYADLARVPFGPVLAAIPPINVVVTMKERA